MIYARLIRPFLFRFDPEAMHDRVTGLLARGGSAWALLGPFLQVHSPVLTQRLAGLTFRNPVGLAAGFDKFARAVPAWPRLGFGFAEIGTITGLAQPGNDRPRLFRLPQDQALINRLGFNNDGAESTARTLKRWDKRGKLHEIPIGINIGKSKAVELSRAADEYRTSFELLKPYGDYFVINVSSPNTPGLRALQDKTLLRDILHGIQQANRPVSKPLFVKIAPELTFAQVDEVLEVCEVLGLAGLVATNTTTERRGLRAPSALAEQEGGMSGRPLKNRSTEIVRHVYGQSRGRLAIIGVGGIFDGTDAYEKILAGASLVQVYTGFVYQGPGLCRAINRTLIRLLRRDGFRNIREAVGAGSARS